MIRKVCNILSSVLLVLMLLIFICMGVMNHFTDSDEEVVMV